MEKGLTKVETKKKELYDFFNGEIIQKQIKESLPKAGITPERLTAVLFSAMAENPMLAECTKVSLYNRLIQCAQLGIEPNTPAGHAYLIPFKKKKSNIVEVQLIIGYKGMINLCMRSGRVKSIYAQEVYKDDEFIISLGSNRELIHRPSYNEKNTQKDIIGCYAVATLSNGSTTFEFMPTYEINKMRSRSKSSDSGPWVTDYIMMARKTAIRRLMHYLPIDNTIAMAVNIDQENDVIEPIRNQMSGDDLTDMILGEKKIEPEVTVTDIKEEKQEQSKTEKPNNKPVPDGTKNYKNDKSMLIKQIYKLASDAEIPVEAVEDYLKVKTLNSLKVSDLDTVINGWDEIKSQLLPEEEVLI